MGLQLSQVESLSVPPYPKDSKLAHRALDLLKAEEDTDMVFEIVHPGGELIRAWAVLCHV